MAHLTSRSAYQRLTERLNRFPQGAPPSESLHRILALLFSEHEAALVSVLPVKPFTTAQAARIWKTSEADAQGTLDALASRALLVDIERDGAAREYVLPPPMAGFFEFSMMRVRHDVDQQVLAELFYQYLNVEEDFVRALFAGGETQLGRAFVHEPALKRGRAQGQPGEAAPERAGGSGGRDVPSPEAQGTECPPALMVLGYERASEVIRTAEHRGVSRCYCRHKMEHVGRACDAPQDICMTFGTTAASLVRHGHARAVDAAEGQDLLREAWERGLVQFGENVRESVSFICNCCGCCCEAMIAARRFAVMHPIHTTPFLPAVDAARCNGCEKCVRACPVEAMVAVSANDPKHPKKSVARVDAQRCLGCGVCVPACSPGALALVERGPRRLTPRDGVHRAVLMAIERGKLQDLVFDNRVLWSHRALAALLGAVLKLPPAKRLLANEQVRSRYLEALLARVS